MISAARSLPHASTSHALLAFTRTRSYSVGIHTNQRDACDEGRTFASCLAVTRVGSEEGTLMHVPCASSGTSSSSGGCSVAVPKPRGVASAASSNGGEKEAWCMIDSLCTWTYSDPLINNHGHLKGATAPSNGRV